MKAFGGEGDSKKKGLETAATVPGPVQSQPLEGTEMNDKTNSMSAEKNTTASARRHLSSRDRRL